MTERTIKLEGPALELARDLRDVFMKGHEDQAALQEEFAQRLNDIQEATKATLQARWPDLLKAAGVVTAAPNEWGLDARYLEAHGVAFLTHQGVDGPEADFIATLPTRMH